MSKKTLTTRSLLILKTLVENYIKHGQPVGSKALCQDAKITLSSASVRSIMSDLEVLGYLTSPHTSSGRIPTTRGYRLFIDHFVSALPHPTDEMTKIQRQLCLDADAKALVAKASSVLSSLTRLTGVVTVPRRMTMRLRQVEFLSLSSSRVLVILVVNDHEVQNRVIETDRVFTKAELEQAGNFITAQYQGHDLCAIRHELVAQLEEARTDLGLMLKTIMDLVDDSNQMDPMQSFIVEGEVNLLGQVKSDQYESLKKLFDAFTQKQDMLGLLDRCAAAKGIKIFVGDETGYAVFDKYSLVSAPYLSNGQVVGVLGVVGPRRMSYQSVLTTVDITAKVLSSMLGARLSSFHW